MISMVLKTYRYENGKKHLVFEYFSLSELVIECFEEISPVAQEKEVEFVYKDNGLNTIIEADRVDMKTVVLNLLSNAVMYSNHNEQVTVNIEVSTNHIQVEITSCFIDDIGPVKGIVNKNLLQIFPSVEALILP
mgnify:CR=1 FL=1